MVRISTSLALILLTWSSLSAATPELKLNVDKSRTELGIPFIAQLTGTGFKEKLSDISLQLLKKDFGVEALEYTSTKRDSVNQEKYTQNYTLKLYPRRTGPVTLPPLSFAGATSKRVDVNVTNANAGAALITIESSISSSSVWSREQILVTVSVTTPDLFASLESPVLQIDNFETFPIKETQTRIKKDGISYMVLRTGWVLFPLGSGRQMISLPPIRYDLDGIIQRVFYLPVQTLNIRKISPYLPPILPVGKVILESEVRDQSLMNTGTLYYWNISLHGDGISPWSLPPVLRQIKSTEDIQFFPADSKRETITDLNGLHGKVLHRIPFKALTSGSLELPDLRIQYFDPDNGRIVNINYHPENIFAIGIIWRLIIGLVLAVLAYQTGMYLYRKWTQFRDYYRLRKAALQSIGISSNALELRASLNLIAESEGWHNNLSLSEWAHNWRSKYKTGNEFADTISELSNLCYSQNYSNNIDELKSRIITIVTNMCKSDKSLQKTTSLDYWLPESFSYPD